MGIVRAAFERQIVFRIAEFIDKIQLHACRQSDDVIERRHRHIVIVFRPHESLLGVRERDLRGEHIGARDCAGVVLRVNIFQMLLQIVDGHLIDLDEVAAFEHPEILARRLVAHGLLRVLKREVRAVYAVARRINHVLDAPARIKRKADLRPAAERIVVPVMLIGAAADTVSLRRQLELRAAVAARLMVGPIRCVHIRHG